MSKILFRLRNVPEDEADDIRGILDDRHLPWFETSSGRWGISFPAIWLRDNDDYPRGRELIDEYQRDRTLRLRAEHQAKLADGEIDTFARRLMRQPARFLLAVAVIGVILYFSVLPFFSIVGN